MAKSIMQEEKVCYLTGSKVRLVLHHCIPGIANRRKADKYGLVVWLNADVHNWIHSSDRKGIAMLKKLKQDAQRRFIETYGEDLWWKTFHKNYLEDE